jgi:hypothetical protein
MINNSLPPLLSLLLQGNSPDAAAQPHTVGGKIHSEDDESDDAGDLKIKPSAAGKLTTVGYNDYSAVQAPTVNDATALSQPSAKEPTFPVKLHMILANPEFQDIITWLPHGRSWRIIQQKAFEERVLPLYFRHGRYSSFARQVNGWGFRRVTHGSDYNSYYHEVSWIIAIAKVSALLRRACFISNPLFSFEDVSHTHASSL